MSILKGDDNEIYRLRDNSGRFRPRVCPVCGDPLVMETHADGSVTWRCDALLDPEDDDKELEACPYETRSGEPPHGIMN